MSRPQFQERFHDYVLGPNQDARLATVAAGAIIKEIKLVTDTDAPFLLRGRAVRQQFGTDFTYGGLEFLRTRWAGPALDYRQQAFVYESTQMANYGLFGNPKPIYPGVFYPPNSVIAIDIENTGSQPLTNLTFYWRGVKLYPWNAVPAYTYPAAFGSMAFTYPIPVLQLQPVETRLNITFTVKPDADFVLRAIQIWDQVGAGPGVIAPETFIRLKDFNYKPYSNDFVHIAVMAGSGARSNEIPIGASGTDVPGFGVGPVAPGLAYPELYLPANHQLLFDIQRADGAFAEQVAQDVLINFIGVKVFKK